MAEKDIEKEIEELEEPLKVEELGEIIIPPEDLVRTSNLEDDLGINFTPTQKEDLVDSGNCSIHKHDDRYYTETEVENKRVGGDNLLAMAVARWRTATDFWTRIAGNTGTTITIEDAPAGAAPIPTGKVHRFALPSGSGKNIYYSIIGQLIPINTNRLYSGRIWVALTNGTGTISVGYRAFDKDGAVLTGCGTGGTQYGNFIAEAATPSSTGIWYAGAITGEGANDAPTHFPVGTRYIQPMVMVNDGENATVEFAGFEIREGAFMITGSTEIIVSDNLRHSNDTEKGTSQTSMTKLKETVVNFVMENVRIKFDLKFSVGGVSGSQEARARIRKNGVDWGSLRAEHTDTYETFSEDLAGIAEGDLIQIYAYHEGGGKYSALVKNFRFYYDIQLVVPTALTNQDP